MCAVLRCFVFVLGVLVGPALAGSEPCSGSMGGVERCEGESFVCVNGKISHSKRNCQASDYAKGVQVVVDRAPEKLGFIERGVLAAVGYGVCLLLWYAARWAWRRFRKSQAKAKA